MEKFSYRSLSFESFVRIWNSAHLDQHLDSWPAVVDETPKSEWEPVFERWLPVMHEVLVNKTPIGYVFISEKNDGQSPRCIPEIL